MAELAIFETVFKAGRATLFVKKFKIFPVPSTKGDFKKPTDISLEAILGGIIPCRVLFLDNKLFCAILYNS